MLMPPREIQRLNTAAAHVRTQARRGELTALIERFREHIERLGESPAMVGALDKARAELAALEQKEAPR
jgi:hypothetical protein